MAKIKSWNRRDKRKGFFRIKKYRTIFEVFCSKCFKRSNTTNKYSAGLYAKRKYVCLKCLSKRK